MNYELAKQLKDAGWPQNIGNNICYYTNPENSKVGGGCFAHPTFPELIEACGEKKDGISEVESKFLLWFNGEDWSAGYFIYGDDLYIDDYPRINEKGETPEEAVANLWLELNKK